MDYGVKLSDAQKRAIVKAAQAGRDYNLKLAKKNLVGGDVMGWTKPQISKLAKAHRMGRPVEIKITKAQLKKMQKRSMEGDGVIGDWFRDKFSKLDKVREDTFKPGGHLEEAVDYAKPVVGKTLRAVAPGVLAGAAGAAGGYFGGPVGSALGVAVGKKVGTKLTSKEVLGFGVQPGYGFTTAGNGFTTAGNGFRTVGSSGGAIAEKPTVGKPGYGSQSSGKNFLEAQRYLYGVALPTSIDGRSSTGTKKN